MEKKSVLLVWWRKIVNHFCKSEVEKRIEETEMPPKTKKLTESVECFLKSRYDFRYNILTEETPFDGAGGRRISANQSTCVEYVMSGSS